MLLINPKFGVIVVLEEDEGGWFIAHVPELPGCISQGAGFSDALANIAAAIEDYLEIMERDDPIRFRDLTSVTHSSTPLEEITTTSTRVWVSA